jgi:deoxyribonuclease-4
MKPLIGAHVSVAGGLFKAFENAAAIGAECVQIFGASPRQWAAPLPSAEAVHQFKDAWKASDVKAVYLHAPYLNNLASPDPAMIKKSIVNLSAHLQITELIGANGLIFHVGSGKESPQEEATAKAIAAMKIILKNVPGSAQLIVENAAGGGAKLGDNAKEVAALVHGVGSLRMKACFDTAHAFESGIIESYTPGNIRKLFDEWDKELGLEHLVALHANDSKTAFNSKHDRHENIGQGYIGAEAFANLAKEKLISHTHWLLEVPGYDNLGPDKKNIDILKKCRI